MIIDLLFNILKGIINLLVGWIPQGPTMMEGFSVYWDHFVSILSDSVGFIKIIFPPALINFLFVLIIFDLTALHIWKLILFIWDKIPFKAS